MGVGAFLAGADTTEADEAGAGGAFATGVGAGLTGVLDLASGFGADFAGVLPAGIGFPTGALTAAFADFLSAEAVFLTGRFIATFLIGAGFLRGCGFFAGAGLVFFFGADLGDIFFLPTGLDLARAAGLAFPWAAFFLVLLDLLTV